MNGKLAAMAITDPPYNVDYEAKGGSSRQGKRRKIENDDLGSEFDDFLLKACQYILRSTEGAVYVFMSSSELHT